MNQGLSLEELNKLRAKLDTLSTAAVICHVNPDGDAIGSALGLGLFLRAKGIDTQVVIPNSPPANLQWMPGYTTIKDYEQSPEEVEGLIKSSEILFCVDFNAPSRAGGAEGLVANHPFKVLIDHHQEPASGWNIFFSEPQRSSTCEMVYDLIDGLGGADLIDVDIATNVYTGIMTDTGSFRYSATKPRTHEIAARLLSKGVQPEQVQERIMNSNSESRMRLWGLALLERMELLHDGQLALIPLSLKDLHRFHYRPGDTEGLVNQGLSVLGVKMAVFIAEQDGYVKMSSRSVGTLPVNEFMRDHFNGGGHINAAGGRSYEDFNTTKQAVKDHSFDFLQAHQ